MTEYEREKRELEEDLEKLTDAADDADGRRSELFGWSIPELWDEDDLDLDEARYKLLAMQGAVSEVASILAYARDVVQDKLNNLHIEETCDNCGAVIVNDDWSLHEDWCEERRD